MAPLENGGFQPSVWDGDKSRPIDSLMRALLYIAQQVGRPLSEADVRRLAAVPGTWVSSDALVGFGWPAGSDSLVAEFSFTTKVQLASWRPGASRLAIVVLRPQHSPASLVIGQHVP